MTRSATIVNTSNGGHEVVEVRVVVDYPGVTSTLQPGYKILVGPHRGLVFSFAKLKGSG